jgi:hypothetical protein
MLAMSKHFTKAPRNQVYVSRFSGSTTAGVLEIDESEGDNVNGHVNGGAQ